MDWHAPMGACNACTATLWTTPPCIALQSMSCCFELTSLPAGASHQELGQSEVQVRATTALPEPLLCLHAAVLAQGPAQSRYDFLQAMSHRSDTAALILHCSGWGMPADQWLFSILQSRLCKAQKPILACADCLMAIMQNEEAHRMLLGQRCNGRLGGNFASINC